MLIDIKVPMLAESVSEATLVTWHKQPGDTIKRGENLIDIETDKVTLEITAPDDGILEEILKSDGMDVTSDEIIARINANSSTTTVVSKTPDSNSNSDIIARELPVLDESQVVELNSPVPDSTVKLNPSARNMAANLEVDLNTVEHNGDRITKTDMLHHIDQQNTQNEPASNLPFTAASPVNSTDSDSIPASDNDNAQRRVPMNRLRQRIAERLLSAQQESAILTTFNEVNMQAVMDLRKRYKEQFEKTHEVKLGFMSLFTKAVVEALKKYPILNASVDGSDIIYHDFYDIGIAVSSPKGLFVPIVRDADLKSLAEIEKDIRQYGEKAQTGSLDIQDLQGGTFTITNGGVFGSLLSTPILNPPQSAILGMHKIQERPVAENGAVVIRPVMYLALSYDHRIIDGREAVQFLVSIKDQLEDPARVLLQI